MQETKRKKIIAVDLTVKGKGGPYTSVNSIINSRLKDKYDFRIINYDPNIGMSISLKRVLDIRKQIIEIKPDVVHYSGLQLVGFHMAFASFLTPVKSRVLTIHGSSVDAISFNPVKKMILRYFLEPLTMLLSTNIISVSDFVRDTKVPKYFKSKCSGTIYNLPPCSDYLQIRDEEFRNSMGFSDTDIIVTSVGRITKEKGYHVLADAILALSDNINIKFILVGDGDYRCEMENTLSSLVKNKKVFFVGYQECVGRYLVESDIFVLPTLHETLSIALLEASHYSLALIASNTGGVPEIIDDGVNGVLVELGKAEDLVQSIRNLVNNDSLRKTYSINAKKMLLRKFNSDEILEKLSDVYSNKKNNE